MTDKPFPEDFDACWVAAGVNLDYLDRVFWDFSGARARQKELFRGEFFIADFMADGSNPYLTYFQCDKHTGRKKGIIRILMTRSEVSDDHQ